MKVLVIGGAGFIGTPLVQQLCRTGHEIAVFHRGTERCAPAVQRMIGDRNRLRQHRDEFHRFDPEIVIDLILSSARQASELLELFRDIAGRIVVASSIDVYRACGVLHGTEPGELEPLPLTEESLLRQHPPYGRGVLQSMKTVFAWLDDEYDKVAVERTLFAQADVPVTVLRLPQVYGPGDKLHRLFPLLKRMADGRQKILFSDDTAMFRWTRGYVENVATAIALAATSERAAARVYNVGEEPALSELRWAEKVAAQAGWDGEFVVVPRARAPKHLRVPANLAQHWVASTRRIRDELGYRERVGLPEALRRTIAWERAHPPSLINAEQFDYEAEDEVLAA